MRRLLLTCLIPGFILASATFATADPGQTPKHKARSSAAAVAPSTPPPPAVAPSTPPPVVTDTPASDLEFEAAATPAVTRDRVALPASAKPEPRTGPSLWLQLSLAGGWMTDQDSSDLAPAFRVGVSVELQPSRRLPLSVFVDSAFASYRTGYLVEGFTQAGGLNTVSTAEHRYDVGIGAAYSIGLAGNRLEFVPRLAIRFAVLQNDVNPWTLGGVSPEAVVRWHVIDAVALEASGGYTYDLFFTHPSEQAVFGRPLSLGTYGLALRYSVSGTPSDIAIGWTGEILTRERSSRNYNFLGVSLRMKTL